jgi:ABC-type uncharacterized transport system substrate-binding protein
MNPAAAKIASFASAQRLPAMYPYREFVEAGGPMSYGPDHVDLFRDAADFVDKILKGSKPEDLPVEHPPGVRGLEVRSHPARPATRASQA